MIPGTYTVNPHMEIFDHRGDTYLLRLPGWARHLEATEYQLRLLLHFEEPMSIATVLEKYPFHRATSTAFLSASIDEQFLLPIDEDGRLRLPHLRRVESTMFRAPHSRPEEPTAFTIVGIPFDVNTTGAPGARFGPHAIRAASEGSRYGYDPRTLAPRGFFDFASGRTLLTGITISDAGDVHLETGGHLTETYDRITDAAYEVFESRTIPIFLGGDHSITFPIVRAMPHDEIGIIHFDAHTDLGEAGPADLHHGNVFSVILDRLEFVTSVYQVGLRGLYEADPDYGHKRAYSFGMDAVRDQPNPEAALLDLIPDGRPYYLSVDIDVLDPAFAPSTGTPVAGGMHPQELKRLIRAVCRAREVIGMDIVEVGPTLGPADSTAPLAVETILTMANGLVERLSANAEEETR